MTFTADRGDAGVRIDRALLRHLSSAVPYSRTGVQRLIADGAVAINGHVARRASTRLARGDQVAVALPAQPPPRALLAQPIALDVLFEDEWIIAVNKPPGLIVHPSYKHPDGTLVNALLWRERTAGGAGEAPRLLHRLDKWTSGVVLASRTASSHGPLLAAMRAPDAEKSYLAVTYGGPRRNRGAIRIPLGRDAHDRRRVVASVEGGRDSLTRYQCLARTVGTRRGLSLLACQLVTGRTHQIRAHLCASGWPLVGDPLYGAPGWERIRDGRLAELARLFPRQALHARRVSFLHPFSGRRVSFEAAVPDDMAALLRVGGIGPGVAGA